MPRLHRLLGRLTVPCSFRTLAVVSTLAAAAATAAGCAGKGDIDRSQPDKLDKSYLTNADGTPKLFYYRWTVIDVPPTNSWAFEGLQGSMDKVYFDVSEKLLVAYRAYAYAPGSG